MENSKQTDYFYKSQIYSSYKSVIESSSVNRSVMFEITNIQKCHHKYKKVKLYKCREVDMRI